MLLNHAAKATYKCCTFIYPAAESYRTINLPRPVPGTGAGGVKAAQSFCTGKCQTGGQEATLQSC